MKVQSLWELISFLNRAGEHTNMWKQLVELLAGNSVLVLSNSEIIQANILITY